MLRYNNLGTTISVSLNNGYIITMMANYDKAIGQYKCRLFINHDDITLLDLIEDNIYLESTPQELKKNMAVSITDRLYSGYFEKFITRYDYQLKCFDIGSVFIDENGTNI